MSIRENFPNTIYLSVTNEYNKGAVVQISTVFGHVNILLLEASSETRLFRHLSDYVLGVPELPKYKIYEGNSFFQNV